MAKYRYRMGKLSFKTLEDKQIHILKMVIRDLQYIGTEGKITITEKLLKEIAIKDVRKVITIIQKQKKGYEEMFKK